MTNPRDWHRLSTSSATDLTDPLHELHWASQLVAAAGQNFVEARDDDSHRAMVWDSGQRGFVGDPFAGPYPFRVGLRPIDLTLNVLDRTGEAPASLQLAGQTLDEAYHWLSAAIGNYTGSLPAIDRPAYDMPGHALAQGKTFGEPAEGRLTVHALYQSASDILDEVVAKHPAAAPVRCWPHHFDIATLVTVAPASAGRAAKTIGIGMAPFGGGYDEWYWYVSPHPRPPADDLPELRGPGSWHAEGWTGTVLTGTELLSADPDFRPAVVRKFIDVSFAASLEALGD